jgi:hypothetical protein
VARPRKEGGFFEEVFSGATCAPCSATAAALSVGSEFVVLLILFCAGSAYDDSSPRSREAQGNSFGDYSREYLSGSQPIGDSEASERDSFYGPDKMGVPLM